MDNAPLALDQLDLPVLKMDDPHFGEDPLPRFAEARRHHPWLARTDLGIVVTEYKAMRELSGRDAEPRPPYQVVISTLATEASPWGDFSLGRSI